MNDVEPGAGEPLVFGVPGRELVAALRGAGLAEDAVVALLGQAIARAAAPQPAGAPGFRFQTQIAESAAECASTYERLFVHPDFIDGVTVVQAGATPEEIGFNARFHSIEAEFDGISSDLHTGSNCVAELRREVYGLARELEAKITEIEQRIDAKGKDKDIKDTKEGKDGKETKEAKDKDTKEGKDKEGKDTKEGKDGKESKEHKEHKDKDKEHIDKVQGLEKLQSAEKTHDITAVRPGAQPGQAPPEAVPEGTDRTFIRLEDRPEVGADALADPDDAEG